jgi:hypothetical protein
MLPDGHLQQQVRESEGCILGGRVDVARTGLAGLEERYRGDASALLHLAELNLRCEGHADAYRCYAGAAALAADTLRVLVGDTAPPLARFYTSTARSRYRYRIGVTTPVTPATGTITYRKYPAGNQPQPGLSNYTIPWILYMVDRKPALTGP